MPSVPDGAAWDLPPRISETLVSEHRDDLLSAPSHRIGPGETVPEAYVRLTMRALFVDALHRLAPQTTHDLASDDAHEIVAQGTRALCTYLMPPYDRQPLDEADRLRDRYIYAWQHRYGLLDAWLHVAAMMTMQRAYDISRQGRSFDAPLILGGATALADLRDDSVSRLPDIPARLDECMQTFDPRIETVDDAVKRLMPDLESRLREHLTAIADHDRTLNGAQDPMTYRKTTAFDWIVRSRVLGESQSEIARADRIHRTHVSKSVNEAAAMIGLTLRKERGGRPRKPRTPPRTIRVG